MAAAINAGMDATALARSDQRHQNAGIFDAICPARDVFAALAQLFIGSHPMGSRPCSFEDRMSCR